MVHRIDRVDLFSLYAPLFNTKSCYEFCGHTPFYSISVSGAFLGTSLPPTPNWSRFDLYIYVYNIVFYCISVGSIDKHKHGKWR